MQKKLLYAMPFVVASLFALLTFTHIGNNSEYRIYDLFLRIKPNISEDTRIALLNVDDLAISKVGVWPWNRTIMADGLLLMKEFGATYAVFDIEYTEKGPRGINADFLDNKMPRKIELDFRLINNNIKDFISAISTGSIKIKDIGDFVSQLEEINNDIKNNILVTMRDVARDNDEYLGKAANYFGNAFFTVNMFKGEEDDSVPQELKKWAWENIPFDSVAVADNSGKLKYFIADDIRPAIAPIIQNGKGAGFPNVFIDNDGVRRRVDILRAYNGKYFPQLSFAPLCDWLGSPEIIISGNKVVLKNAVLPGSEIKKDIIIPLVNGQMLINWPAKSFEKSFRHMTYWYIELHKRLYESLANNIVIMKEAGFLDYYNGDVDLYDTHFYIEDMLSEMIETGDKRNFEEYVQIREYFLQEIKNFLDGDAERNIFNDIDKVLAAANIDEGIRANYSELKENVSHIFGSTREILAGLLEVREILHTNLNGAFCIIGNTGTSTTDIGVNPFEKEYMNVGTHASVANTILSEKFLVIVPVWIPVIFSFIFSFAVFLLIKEKNPINSVITGISFLIAIIVLATIVFRITGIYFHIIPPAGSVFITFIIYTMFNLITTSREKAFIKNAFGHYLSQDVISQLLDNPEKLKLGGDKKELTVIFTDVKGFSTISEKLDPSELVKILNEYLTAMSDIILDERGTIDKYEGDAIISFFGAPVDFSDHAVRACASAVKMKKKENEINNYFAEKEILTIPLLTRIGINTGDMVVGNMGTARKMDYTVMGNAVNLAARLEGVNKQYGTWVLASEYTIAQTSDRFACRKLDQVRVVGINKPVQLYELIDEKKEATDKVLTAIDLSEKGIEKFREQNWVDSIQFFDQVLKILPNDGPALTFIKRCKDYKISPPGTNWDGVFNLVSK
ncbi:MAG: CHASE2 domain-containing protein [Spirochaetaceae bacterium]|nr:CHASE2 domain-containing protein [Spirochaetaceae bacterium]